MRRCKVSFAKDYINYLLPASRAWPSLDLPLRTCSNNRRYITTNGSADQCLTVTAPRLGLLKAKQHVPPIRCSSSISVSDLHQLSYILLGDDQMNMFNSTGISEDLLKHLSTYLRLTASKQQSESASICVHDSSICSARKRPVVAIKLTGPRTFSMLKVCFPKLNSNPNLKHSTLLKTHMSLFLLLLIASASLRTCRARLQKSTFLYLSCCVRMASSSSENRPGEHLPMKL
jgi:hypothetical protein